MSEAVAYALTGESTLFESNLLKDTDVPSLYRVDATYVRTIENSSQSTFTYSFVENTNFERATYAYRLKQNGSGSNGLVWYDGHPVPLIGIGRTARLSCWARYIASESTDTGSSVTMNFKLSDNSSIGYKTATLEKDGEWHFLSVLYRDITSDYLDTYRAGAVVMIGGCATIGACIEMTYPECRLLAEDQYIVGVSISSTSTSPTMKRLTGASDDPFAIVNWYPSKEATAGSGSTAGYSEFDDFPALVTRKVTLSSESMVELPTSYIRALEYSGTIYLYMSNQPFFTGSDTYPSNVSRLAPWSGHYIGRYQGTVSSSTLHSVTGSTPPVSSYTLAQLRTYAQNKGTGWGLTGLPEVAFIQWGVMMEYLTLDSQTAIGTGYYSSSASPISNGSTDSMSYHTGVGSNSVIQYRYIENAWSGIGEVIDGILSNTSGTFVYENPAEYSSSISTSSQETLFSTNTQIQGVTKLSVTSFVKDKPWYIGIADYSSTTSTSFNTYTCDRFFRCLATSSNVYIAVKSYGYSSSAIGAFSYMFDGRTTEEAYFSTGRLSYYGDEQCGYWKYNS